MAFRVKVVDSAIRDAEAYYTFILQRSHDRLPADAWQKGLSEAIASLQLLPTRCPRIPEQTDFAISLQQLIYASHRIIFHIHDETVEVLRIYHGSLRPLRSLHQRSRLKKTS